MSRYTTRPQKFVRAVLLLLAMVVTVVACTDDGDGSASSRAADGTGISWGECPVDEVDLGDGETVEVPMEGLECATVDVPLDYGDAEAGTIELFVARRPAIGDDPIGPLFVNQGGPGMPSAGYAASIAAYGGLDRFDVIGMDPRGTGRSTHLDCEISGTAPPPMLAAEPAAEPTPYERAVQDEVEVCTQDPRLEFFGTNNAARDIDHIRALLGAEQISYHGKSYGSDLGAAYLSLYPDRVRAAVLDGATDLTLDPVDFMVQQARAASRQLDRYLERCEIEGCAWTEGADPRQAWDGLVARVSSSPIVDAESGATFTAHDLVEFPGSFIGTPLEDVDQLLDALVRDGEVSELADDELESDVATAFIAITCLDLPLSDTAAAHARFLESGLVPPTDVIEELAYCGAWPAEDPIRINEAATSGPVLVISTRGDVPTPYESGVGVAAALANAELLTFDADTHTAYVNSECVRGWALGLLIDLEQPPPGTTCDDDSPA